MKARTFILAFILSPPWLPAGAAEPLKTREADKVRSPSRNVVVEPEHALDGVDLRLTMNVRDQKQGKVGRTVRSKSDGQSIAVGEYIDLCFESSTEGYVTLWSRSAGGTTTRIYPNAYSHPEGARAARVTAGEQTCPGAQSPAFRFRVDPPLGDARVLLHWSETEETGFEADLIPVIGNPEDFKAGRGTDRPRQITTPYASTTIDYKVTQK